ncbi:MAG: hypothetical protein F4X35_07855, partial [Alphaproteobacteria bacterium]|nr:hypothetical protein [Alphaproteobacteria bacterium]
LLRRRRRPPIRRPPHPPRGSGPGRRPSSFRCSLSRHCCEAKRPAEPSAPPASPRARRRRSRTEARTAEAGASPRGHSGRRREPPGHGTA